MVCDSFLSEISSGLIFNECSICDISDGFMKEHCNNSLVFVYLYLHEGYCLVIIKKKMIYYQRFCKVYLPFNLERIQRFPELGKHLIGIDIWSLRIGKYRVLYSIKENNLQILVLTAMHRK